MGALAREFNYSETAFVLPPKEPGHTACVRIFTPAGEIPFAGHPVIGSAYVIASKGRDARSGSLVLEVAAGSVPLRIMMRDGDPVGAELTAPKDLTLQKASTAAQIADCTGLSAEDILLDEHEPLVMSVGLPFLAAQVRTREALRRARGNPAAFAPLPREAGTASLYLYTLDVGDDRELDLQARM